MKTIYFAHDQQESPALRAHILEIAGFEVRLLQHPDELFAAIEEQPPALVLLDVLLEGPNGFRVCEELAHRYPSRSFPIVICTQIYRARQFREEALALGAADYVLLPIGFEEFAECIRQAIARHGTLDSSGQAA